MTWHRTMIKKVLSVALVFTLIVGSWNTAYAGKLNDYEEHWAKNEIQSWINQGLISGFKDGTFKPNGDVTRAQLLVLVNKSFGFTEDKSIVFKDVKGTEWFNSELLKANAAGYLTVDDDGAFKPSQAVTRQETAIILSKLLSLSPSQTAGSLAELDNASEQTKSAVGAVIDAKLMSLNGKGLFRSNDHITRAEAVVILTRALKVKQQQMEVVFSKPGVYGPAKDSEIVTKNVTVTSPGVTLQNMTIEGNLTIAESVGNGDVFLKNVSVKGTTTVNGGGANSVHFNNSIIVKVVVNKKDGSVRIVVEGSTEVRDVILQSGAKLEESNSTGSGFQNVTLAESLPQDSKITLSGKFETVDVLAASISVEIPQGQVDNLNIDKKSGDVTVNVSKEAKIVDLILAAVAKIIGEGVIENANIQADGATIEQTPTKVELGKDVKAEVGGKPAVNTVPAEVSTPISNPGPSNPGSSNSQPSVDKTALLTAIQAAQLKHNEAIEGIEIDEYRFGAKAELQQSINDAKAVYDNANATQSQVNGALSVLNLEVMLFGYLKNTTSVETQFHKFYDSSKLLYNSVAEVTGPGQPAQGTKAVFGEAITAARLVINNASATPQEISEAYNRLVTASMSFRNQFSPNDNTELESALGLVEQALAAAVEGEAPGQYRMGAKALLQMGTQGSYHMLEPGFYRQKEIKIQAMMILRFLTKFEEDKIPENDVVITSNNGNFVIAPEKLNINATVTGAVYIVPYEEFPVTLSDLNLLVSEGKSIPSSVEANVAKQIDVSSLPIGDYKVYHIDAEQKWSKAFVNFAFYPQDPANINVTTQQSAGEISNTISWTDSVSAGVYYYTVYRGTTDQTLESTGIVEIAPGVQQYIDNDPDLLPNTTYYYYIVSTNRSGTGIFSGRYTVTTPE